MVAGNPKASIIICTYNKGRMEDLIQCLASLLNQKFRDFEILAVVDHNEKLYKTLATKYSASKVRVLLNNSKNIGQASTMNCGVKNSSGDIMCFIDDDAIADENWLSELMKGYDDDTCAVGGRIEPLWIDNKPSYLPEEFYWMIGATGSYLSSEVREVRNLWSGNISYGKTVFDKVGLFSEDLGEAGSPLFQGEDAEFSMKLLRTLGKAVKYIPTALVYHKVHGDRVKFKSLLKRAYGQGYAKAYIRKLHNNVNALSVEQEYLRLLFKSSLKRLKRISFGPGRIDALKQLTFTFVATITVFFGFISGSIRDYYERMYYI